MFNMSFEKKLVKLYELKDILSDKRIIVFGGSEGGKILIFV